MRSLALWTAAAFMLFCMSCQPCFADAAADLQQAEDLAKEYRCQDAVEMLEKAATDAPSFISNHQDLFTRALLEVAKRYSEQGRHNEAIAALRQGLKRVSTGTASGQNVESALSQAILHGCDSNYIPERELAKAQVYYQGMISRYPTEAHWPMCLSKCFSMQKDHQSAVAVLSDGLQRAKADDPCYRLLEYWLGQSYMKAGDLDSSAGVYRTMTDKYPGEARWPLWLGRCYQKQGRYVEAIGMLKNAIASTPSGDPDVPKLRFGVVQDYISLWDLDSALLESQAYVDACPDDINARSGVWYCLCAKGRVEDALAYLETLGVERLALNEQCLLWKAETRMMFQHDPQQAREILVQLLAQSTDAKIRKTANTRLGQVMLDLKQMPEAKEHFRRLGETEPGCVDWRFYSGYCLYREKDWAEAKDVFQSICDTSRGGDIHSQALYLLGDCYLKLGDTDAAKAAFEQEVVRFPGFKWADEAKMRLRELGIDISKGKTSSKVAKADPKGGEQR